MYGKLKVLLVTAVLMLVLLPATSQAVPSYTALCNKCHARSTSIPVKVTRVSATKTAVKYKASLTGRGWAVFVGSKKLLGKQGKGGTFTVAKGKKFTVFSVTYPSCNYKTQVAK